MGTNLKKVKYNNLRELGEALYQLQCCLASTTVVIKNISSDTLLDTSAYQWNVDTTAKNITVSLPPGIQGQTYKIVNAGTGFNTLTVVGHGSETVIQASSFNLSDGESILISFDKIKYWL